MAFQQEMRRQPRVAHFEEIWIGQDGIFSRTGGHIRNISTSGVFIETEQSFGGGSVVNLRFSLGESKELVNCSAIVRNVQPGLGLGVEFLDLSSGSRNRIAAFVAEQGGSLRSEGQTASR
jgi:hypothetical protein